MNDLISVIVPVYNVAQYIAECLDGLCAQTCDNLEFILIDDGSTDGSGGICDEYALRDSRFRVIHTSGGGVSRARNIGLENARGSFIGFADADDIAAPELFSELYGAIAETQSDIAVCGYAEICKSSDIAGVPAKDGVRRAVPKREALSLLLGDRGCTSHLWNKLFRRETLDGITFPEGKYYEDMAVIHLIFENAEKFVFFDTPLYYYRQREGSIIRMRDLKGWQDCLDAWAGRYERYEDDAEFMPLISRNILKTVCRGTDSLNYMPITAEERRSGVKMFKSYYDLYCKKQTKRFSSAKAKMAVYIHFPHFMRFWRTKLNPFIGRILHKGGKHSGGEEK